MKKILFVASVCVASAAWAIELNPGAVIAETQLVTQQQTDSPQESVRSTKLPQIELLSPGAEPRQELRLKPVINVKETAVMTVKMDMAMSFGGQSSPAVKTPASVMTWEATVTKIDANGDIHSEFTYTNAELAGDTANLPAPVIDSMRSLIKNLIGIKGSFVTDNRGFHKAGGFIVPEKTDSKVKQMIQQMSKSLEQISMPLPAEAVGKGAKWRIISESNVTGIKVNNIATYELTDLQDGTVAMNVGIEQQANPQNVTSPQLPPGSNVTLKSLSTQGRGSTSWRMDRLTPLRSTVSISSNSEMSLKSAGTAEETTIATKMEMEMTLESK
ncbi:MAG: hypothetical protein ACRC62_30835 [Microcoleus sp.]